MFYGSNLALHILLTLKSSCVVQAIYLVKDVRTLFYSMGEMAVERAPLGRNQFTQKITSQDIMEW